MRAMILAAGGATRLYPLTYTLPKPLVPVVNIPVVEHILVLLRKHGIHEVIINVKYLHRVITDYLGDGSRWGLTILYSYENELLGTAGGVKNVASYFNDTFLVIGGDDLTDLDLGRLVEVHRSKGGVATMALYREGDPCDYGVAGIDEQGKVLWYREKPKDEELGSFWVNTGIYVLEPSIFEHIPARSCYDFGKDLFPALLAKKELFYGEPILNSYWCDVGDHMRYRQAHFDILEGKARIPIPGEEIRPQVWVEEGGYLSPQAMVVPPVLIGKGAKVEKYARLEGPVVLGREVEIGAKARISSSVIWELTRVGPRCIVEGSLIGASCTLGEGRRYRNMVIASGARLCR